MASTPKLNRTQFDKIAKRFVSSNLTQGDLAIPYLIGDHIIASNSSSAVSIRMKRLNHPYILMAEDASTKAMLERLVERLFTNFETDISLVVSRRIIRELVKFLKEVRRGYKKYEIKVEISCDVNRGLRFIVKHLGDNTESFIQEYEVECESEETTLYNDEHFTTTVSINHLIDAMLTLRESDNESILNFQIDPMSPMLFSNSSLQIILTPVRDI